MKRALSTLTAICALAAPASAFVVDECGPEFTPMTITEPWEESSQAFANGAIRIFEVFIDPNVASGAALGVLHPVPSDAGGPFRRCTAIYASGVTRFFGQAFINQATAVYDASAGLIITVPIAFADGSGTRPVTFAVNQATGTVTLR
ncbi:hypothetical protein [Gymnodinialimonas hymeniacidonis]|uniref:hypothetical protein n=1 Tax=Gymnodinialimonas hymeniacidonis TaxID=3126508 RepID=UPI0034C65907